MMKAEDEEVDDAAAETYKEEVSRLGFNVSPIGELVFPNGRIMGHRGLQRYLEQRTPQPSPYIDSTAVVAAERAAGERLYRGHAHDTAAAQEEGAVTILQLPLSGDSGGADNGILAGGGSGSVTALSLYRYRTVVKKIVE